jgi:uncharacterized membrane protein HdeD (DUF308 family)
MSVNLRPRKSKKGGLKLNLLILILSFGSPLLLVGFIHYVAYVHRSSSAPNFWILKIKQPSLPVFFVFFVFVFAPLRMVVVSTTSEPIL